MSTRTEKTLPPPFIEDFFNFFTPADVADHLAASFALSEQEGEAAAQVREQAFTHLQIICFMQRLHTWAKGGAA